MAESFFSTLPRELPDERRWDDRRELALGVFVWIPKRRHTSVGSLSPLSTKPPARPSLLRHEEVTRHGPHCD